MTSIGQTLKDYLVDGRANRFAFLGTFSLNNVNAASSRDFQIPYRVVDLKVLPERVESPRIGNMGGMPDYIKEVGMVIEALFPEGYHMVNSPNLADHLDDPRGDLKHMFELDDKYEKQEVH